MPDNSGPAFPRPYSTNSFNYEQYWGSEGMSRRQWLAGLAMQALIAERIVPLMDVPHKAYEMADEMLNFEGY